MKKKKILFITVSICAIAVILFFWRRGRNINDTIISEQTEDGVVFGAQGHGEDYSVSDSGLLFGKNGVIHYYDLMSDIDYVLCDKANCLHFDTECGAWYGDAASLSGLALYRDRIFSFRKNEEKNIFELVSTNTSGNDRHIVSSIPIGSMEGGTWLLSSIEEVYYIADRAVARLNYIYVTDQTMEEDNMNLDETCGQYIWIDLKSGEITEINERSTEQVVWKLEGIQQDNLIFSKRENRIPLLSKEEFESAYQTGKIQDDGLRTDNREERYYYYMNDWYPLHCEPFQTYLCYDWNTLEETALDGQDMQIMYGTDGNYLGELSVYLFEGSYGDSYLVEKPVWEGSGTELFLLNKETGEKTLLLHIEDGGILAMEQGNMISVIFEESKLLYCEYKAGEKADIFLFDIASKESRKLFEDERNITFRIIDDTQEYFIGKIYSESGYDLYKIAKNDYYNGSFDKAVKLNV